MTVQSNANLPDANFRKLRGFTLTEIAIVLGIAGLILGAVWGAAASVYGNMKISDAQKGITQTALAVRSLYSSSNDTGIAAAALITAPGIFSVSWSLSTNPIIIGNPWIKASGTISYAGIVGLGSKFAVVLTGVSADGCVALLNYFSSAASNANGGLIMGLIGVNAKSAAAAVVTATSGDATALLSTPGFLPAKTGCTGVSEIAISFDMTKM